MDLSNFVRASPAPVASFAKMFLLRMWRLNSLLRQAMGRRIFFSGSKLMRIPEHPMAEASDVTTR